jgi:hypothetical protein
MASREVERAAELSDRSFSPEFLELRRRVLEWLTPYYDGVHLARAGHWILALEPSAPEELVIAAMTHDMERSVPGGPWLDKATQRWDDPEYNRVHCERSVAVVAEWLRRQDASDRFVSGVRVPILEHEFGGSPEGDLMQAADSLSFLEVDSALTASWVLKGECSLDKAKEKLDFMYERIRLERARELARPYYDEAYAALDRRVAEAAGASR